MSSPLHLSIDTIPIVRDSGTLAERLENLSGGLDRNKGGKIPIKNYPNPINEN